MSYSKFHTVALFASCLLGALTLEPSSATEISEKAIIEQLGSFNSMREALAASIDPQKGPITPDTFEKTCKPVGRALAEWAKKFDLEVKQISHKYRNPNHAASKEELKIIERFQNDSKLIHWVDGKSVYYRIPVVQACLHCHGPKASRPDFIVSKYPKDLAFDFAAGDLRGLYRVKPNK